MSKQIKLNAYDGFDRDVKELYGEVTIYGPYVRNSDSRSIVQIRFADRSSVTKLYAKVLLEIKEGRILSKDETVDHIDENPKNDCPSNLRLLTRPENSKRSSLQRIREPVNCVWCRMSFIPTKDQVKTRGQKRAGPFCGRSCAGKYSQKVQTTGETWSREKIEVKYFKETD
ncbi:hypothetical protein D3C87_279270 [compost metagenome]